MTGGREPVEPAGDAFTVRVLRAYRHCTQSHLAQATGLHQTTLSRYENGRMRPRRSTLARLAAGGGLAPAALERLLTVLRSIAAPEPAGHLGHLTGTRGGAAVQDILRAISGTLVQAIGELAFLDPWRAATIRSGAPPGVLERLLAIAPEERRVWVERVPELRDWETCVLVCEASVAAAAHKAKAASELAELALFIAERVSGSDLWRARVQGYAWAFVGNARRVSNDLDGAERAFTMARSLWE